MAESNTHERSRFSEVSDAMRGLFERIPDFLRRPRVRPDKINCASLRGLRREVAWLSAARLWQSTAFLSWIVGRDEGHHLIRLADCGRTDVGGAQFLQPQKRLADAVAHAGFMTSGN